jgi:hypothetical protein
MVSSAPWERSDDEEQLPLDQTKWHEREIPLAGRRNARPEFLKFIDDEFVSVALERQLQMWGKAPDSVEVDDSTWIWDKERARKAKENKAKEPGPFGMPRLQLHDLPRSEPPIAIPDELMLKDQNR